MYENIVKDQIPVSIPIDGECEMGTMEKRPMTESDLMEMVEARWSGMVSYRSMVRRERLEEVWARMGKRTEHRLMRYPILVRSCFPDECM